MFRPRVTCLGLDPLEVGNEGKYIIGVVAEKAEEALEFLKQTKEGKNAQIIGEATSEFKGVAMQTEVGGKRIIARPVATQCQESAKLAQLRFLPKPCRCLRC